MTTTTGDALASDPPERQQRFEALLREHRRIVFHIARVYAGNTDERHDLVQEFCAALILPYLEDRSYAEIADVLGISETNVATKISRIKQRFRQQMTGAASP